MKPIRWSNHALQKIVYREIDRVDVERTLHEPHYSIPGDPPRSILMRRYFDTRLQQEMLLRVVIEDTETERIVITVYKTSQIEYYLKGLLQ